MNVTELLSHFREDERWDVLESLPAKYLWLYVMEVKARGVRKYLGEYREARRMYRTFSSENLCLVKASGPPKPPYQSST